MSNKCRINTKIVFTIQTGIEIALRDETDDILSIIIGIKKIFVDRDMGVLRRVFREKCGCNGQARSVDRTSPILVSVKMKTIAGNG